MNVILYSANALVFWWLFTIWRKTDVVNLIIKMIFLLGALANTIAALAKFGLVVLV